MKELWRFSLHPSIIRHLYTTYSPGTAPAVIQPPAVPSTYALHGALAPKKQLDQKINIGFDQGAFNTSVYRAKVLSV
jgi:hypothetical protein